LDLSSTKYNNLDIINKLNILKGEKGQKEFAEWIGISITTINNYFTGYSRPGIDFLLLLANKGINVNWFLTGNGPVFVNYPENAIYSPEEQVFLYTLETEEEGVTNKEEAIKAFRQLRDFQNNTNASKHEYSIGLKLLKVTYGKKHQKPQVDNNTPL